MPQLREWDVPVSDTLLSRIFRGVGKGWDFAVDS